MPDKVLQRIQSLREQLEHHNYLYYVQAKPQISDQEFDRLMRELTDLAYFRGSMIVASAHNLPVESYPWRFSAVLSVGSHAGADPLEYYANPHPPVEFAAPGIDLELAWSGGSTIRASGNSFATPHIAAIAALVLAKHPGMRPFELKTALRAASSNVRSGI